uniref:Savignygrin-like protein n=1 Tax=Ornithodoros coriaceus TaxID=92741 RepID=B2D2C7_ORNCO|nr:savignygrin-like protein [Ornithodoros coriaceus]
MQSKVLFFAFVLLVSAILVHGTDDRCNDQPLYWCRRDDHTEKGWTYSREDGSCTEVSYCATYPPTTTNHFKNRDECKQVCP